MEIRMLSRRSMFASTVTYLSAIPLFSSFRKKDTAISSSYFPSSSSSTATSTFNVDTNLPDFYYRTDQIQFLERVDTQPSESASVKSTFIENASVNKKIQIIFPQQDAVTDFYTVWSELFESRHFPIRIGSKEDTLKWGAATIDNLPLWRKAHHHFDDCYKELKDQLIAMGYSVVTIDGIYSKTVESKL